MINLKQAVSIDKTISIIGESGTGKSSIARKIHLKSSRKYKKFIHVNVLSLSKNLFESEMFGHVKGSFSGAISNKKGFLEDIEDGTLFIDEISGLDLELQSKLLSVLEEKEFYPIGSTQVKKFRGRILFASSEKLEELVSKNKMRFDFYQRIKAFTLNLEPLRKSSDLKRIIRNIFDSKKIEYSNFEVSLSNCAEEYLASYNFMGNYRELHNILDYIVLLYKRDVLKNDLPIQKEEATFNGDNYYDAFNCFEKEFLYSKLKKYDFKINYTAERINISKVTLISKIKKYDINIKKLKSKSFKVG